MTQNPKQTISFQFEKIPKPFSRGDRALIVLQNQEGKYLMGMKNAYPTGICRLAGGGIEVGEIPSHAACRELHEELGLVREPNQWEKEQVVIAHIKTPTAQKSITFYLFKTTLDYGEKVTPNDDVDGILWYTTEEMNALIDRFYDLSEHLQPGWADYGKVYGKIHEIALTL